MVKIYCKTCKTTVGGKCLLSHVYDRICWIEGDISMYLWMGNAVVQC